MRTFGTFVPYTLDVPLSREVSGNRMPTYRPDAEADGPTTPTFRYWPRSSGAITYDKTALWMHTLERHLGWPTMQRVMAAYYDRWKFRHPRPQDFFQVVNEVSGQDLTWFFDEVYRSSEHLRLRRAGPQERGRRPGPLPHDRGGAAARRGHVPGRGRDHASPTAARPPSAGTAATVASSTPTTGLARDPRVEVDPGQVLLLDVNRTNNTRTTQPRAAEAARKWSLTWMVWLQELMITSGFFG